MKKTFFLVFAISILFCFSTVSYGAVHSHDNDITVLNISLKNATEEQHNFFYEWNNTPQSNRILISNCVGNVVTGKPPCKDVMFIFYIYERPPSYTFKVNLNSGYSNQSYVDSSAKFPQKRLSLNFKSLPFTSIVSPVFLPSGKVQYYENSGTSHFTNYHSAVSAPFSTIGTTDYDWNKDTPITINFDVDITKPWQDPTIPPSSSSEPPPPPSSSSEPTPPPVFPPIEIPSGPSELPPINIPDVDRPVIVPPYDDEYVWYDPNAWEDFFNHINSNIGKVVTMSIIILCLIFSIILILKVIKYFVRGDDIFRDWRL